MNLGDIREAVRDDVEEPTAAFWSDDLLNRYINRSVRMVRSQMLQVAPGFFDREAEGTYPGGTREVSTSSIGLPDVPFKMLMVTDISSSGTGSGTVVDHLDILSEPNLALRGDTLSDVSGARQSGYYMAGGPAGQRMFGLRPTPAASRTLRFRYIAQAGELSVDSQEPDIPEDFHEAIVLRATILAKMREESPIQDYDRQYRDVMQNALIAVEGRHLDRFPRVGIAEPELLLYDS